MLKLKFGKKTWIERWGERDLSRTIRLVHVKALRKYFRKKYNQFKKEKRWVLLAALCAYVKQYFIHEFRQMSLPVLPVHYEKLVTNPKKEVKKILRFIGAEWNPAVLSHHTTHTSEWGGTRGQRKIDRKSLQKWKHFFSTKEKAEIDLLIKELERERKNVS